MEPDAWPRVRWPLACRRHHRHPLQPARPRGRPRGDRRAPASRRSGASATSSATAPSPTPAPTWSASAATSAWSATTTSRCSASSTSPPSRRPRRRRSSWTRENVAEETLEFLRELEPAGRARGARPLPRLPPRPDLGVRALARAGRRRASTSSRERIGLIGHSHVSLFFTRPERRPGARRRAAPRPATARCSSSARRRWLINPGSVGQPRDGDPRAAWLELDTDAAGRPASTASPTTSTAAAAAIVEAGLPSRLADRLQVGQ